MNFHKTLFRDFTMFIVIIFSISIIKLQMLNTFANTKSNEVITQDITNENILQYFDKYSEFNQQMTYIPCDVLFDINIHPICVDVPEYYYKKMPWCYDKVKIYFNLKKNINYTKLGNCQIDDIILSINKIDYNIVNKFWIIS